MCCRRGRVTIASAWVFSSGCGVYVILQPSAPLSVRIGCTVPARLVSRSASSFRALWIVAVGPVQCPLIHEKRILGSIAFPRALAASLMYATMSASLVRIRERPLSAASAPVCIASRLST